MDEQLLSFARKVLEVELKEATNLPERLDNNFLEACHLILNCKGKIIVSGIGKSGHIGKKIAASLASTGTPSFFVHPAEALHGDLGMINSHDILIFISYSGQATELDLIIPLIKHNNIPLIAITGNNNSILSAAAHCILDISVEREACPIGVAPTSSTVNTLMMGDALAISLMQYRGFSQEDFARSHPGGSLGKKLLCLVKDVMQKGKMLPVVTPFSTIKDAIMELSRTGLGLIAICEENNHIIGVFTDGDLRRWLNDGRSLDNNIKEAMTKPGYRLPAQWHATKALNFLHEQKITAAPVVDDNGILVGALNIHRLHEVGII